MEFAQELMVFRSGTTTPAATRTTPIALTADTDTTTAMAPTETFVIATIDLSPASSGVSSKRNRCN